MKSQDYIATLSRSYNLIKLIVTEISELLEYKKLPYLSTALKCIQNSYTLIYDSLIDFNTKTAEELTKVKISKGVGLLNLNEFSQRLTSQGAFISKTRSMTLNNRLQKLQGTQNKKAYLEIKKKLEEIEMMESYKQFEFGDDDEMVERRIKENVEFENKIDHLYNLLGTRGVTDAFIKEKDPKVIVELCKRALREMHKDTRKNILSIRDKLAGLEKYSHMEPEAPEEIEKIVDGLLLKVRFMELRKLKRVNMKHIRADYSEAENALLTSVDQKCHKIAGKVANFIIENQPEKLEKGTMTKMNCDKINTLLIRKSNQGDKYASKVIRTRINNLEKRNNKLNADLKKISLENLKLKTDNESLSATKTSQTLDINDLKDKVDKLEAKVKGFIMENEKILFESDEKLKQLRSRVETIKAHYFDGFDKFKDTVGTVIKFMKASENENVKFSSLDMMEYIEAKVTEIANHFNKYPCKKRSIDTVMDYSLKNFDLEKFKDVLNIVKEIIIDTKKSFGKRTDRSSSGISEPKSLKRRAKDVVNAQRVFKMMRQSTRNNATFQNKTIEKFSMKKSQSSNKGYHSNRRGKGENSERLMKPIGEVKISISSGTDKKSNLVKGGSIEEVSLKVEEEVLLKNDEGEVKNEVVDEPSNTSFLQVGGKGKSRRKSRVGKKSNNRSRKNSRMRRGKSSLNVVGGGGKKKRRKSRVRKSQTRIKIPGKSKEVKERSDISKFSVSRSRSQNQVSVSRSRSQNDLSEIATREVSELVDFFMKKTQDIEIENQSPEKIESVKKSLAFFIDQTKKTTLNKNERNKVKKILFNFMPNKITYTETSQESTFKSEFSKNLETEPVSPAHQEIEKKISIKEIKKKISNKEKKDTRDFEVSVNTLEEDEEENREKSRKKKKKKKSKKKRKSSSKRTMDKNSSDHLLSPHRKNSSLDLRNKSSSPRVKTKNKRTQTTWSFTDSEINFLSTLKKNRLIDRLMTLTNGGNSLDDEEDTITRAMSNKLFKLKRKNSKSFNIRSKQNDNFRSFYTVNTKTDEGSKQNRRRRRNNSNKGSNQNNMMVYEDGYHNSEFTKGMGDERTKISGNSSLGYRNKNIYRRNKSGNFGDRKFSDNMVSLKSANFEKCKIFFNFLNFLSKLFSKFFSKFFLNFFGKISLLRSSIWIILRKSARQIKCTKLTQISDLGRRKNSNQRILVKEA